MKTKEAARLWALKRHGGHEMFLPDREESRQDFIAGAEWQKEQEKWQPISEFDSFDPMRPIALKDKRGNYSAYNGLDLEAVQYYVREYAFTHFKYID